MAVNFGELMQNAAVQGREQRTQEMKSIKDRIDGARNRASSAWEAIKGVGSRIKSGLESADAVVRGVSSSPEVRNELRQFVNEKIEDRKGRMADAAEARRETNAIKREQLASAVEDRVNALKHSATEKLKSVRDGAVDLKNKAVKGAETGLLFTVGAGVLAYEKGVQAVDAGITKGKEVASDVTSGVERGALFVAGETVAKVAEAVGTGLDLKDRAINTVDQKVNYAKQKAREFGDAVNDSYTRQKETVQREMAVRSSEVRSKAHEAMGRASYSIFEKLSRFIDRGQEFAADHRNKAVTLKQAATNLRAQGVTAPAD